MKITDAVATRIQDAWIGWRSRRVYRVRVRPRIDMEGFRVVRSRYVSGEPPYTGYSKYFDIDTYCRRDVRRAMLFGLHRGSSRSVLDLGCGMGYFLLACNLFGHQALGIDIAESEKYQDVIDFLKLDRVIHEIKPGEPLPPLGRTFDLITAFQVTFNSLDKPDQWRPPEWDFFLREIHRHLNPGGILFLQMNADRQGVLYDERVASLFRRKGAVLRGQTVRIPADGLLRG